MSNDERDATESVWDAAPADHDEALNWLCDVVDRCGSPGYSNPQVVPIPVSWLRPLRRPESTS